MAVCAAIVCVLCLGALSAALGIAAATDLNCRIVPNGCVAAVACSGIVRAVIETALDGRGPRPVARAVAGAFVVLAVMLLAARLSSAVGDDVGVGGGDVKLLSAVGVWTGPLMGLVAVGLSCLLGVAGWLLARVARRALTRRLPDEETGAARARDGIPLAPAVALTAVSLVLLGKAYPL